MTLFSWNEKGPIAGHDDKYKTGISGRRWAAVLNRVGFGIEHQCKRADGWGDGAGYYMVGAWWKFRLGYSSMYYDGQHHTLCIGPFYLTWMS